MPIFEVKKGSYRWGTHGKVYSGPKAKEKAEKQRAAAIANGYVPKENE